MATSTLKGSIPADNVTFDKTGDNKRVIYVSIGYSNGNSNVNEYINMDFTGGDVNG